MVTHISRSCFPFSKNTLNYPFFHLQYFQGNSDRYTVRTQAFSPPIKAVYFRVMPKGWYSYIAMRLELYGCPESKLVSIKFLS